MATDNESFNRDLYDLLKVRGYQPVPLDSKNQRVPASQAADVIQFTFTKDGEEYGKAWVSIDDAANVIVYYDEEQQESPSSSTPGVEYDDSWTGFLKHLKNWAQRRQLSFELSNKDRLGDDMRQRDYYKMKEKVSESYHPMGKKASYNDAVPSVKIVLQHNRALEEGEQRYRNVSKIFLENQEGERFLAPTTRPGIARVYARHIAEGGVPNDDKWNHIKTVVEDYNKMAGFVRATRNGQFNESAQELVNEGINHYNSLRETLHKLSTHRGYQNYFESWSPPLMEDELDESINDLFVQEMVDPRIESAMPILSRLKKPVNEMEEVDALAEWADGIINEKLGLDESETLKIKNIELEAPRFKMWDSNKGPIPFSATLEQGGKPVGQVEIMVDADASPNAWNQEDVNINSIKVTSNGKEIDPKTLDIPYIQIKSHLLDVIGDPSEWGPDNSPPRRNDYLYDLDEGDVVPFRKKDDDDLDDDSWIPSEEDFEQEEKHKNRKPKAANDVNEMEKDLHQGQRHDPRKGPAGPDRTAKMMAAKKAIKDARKSLDKAFKGDVEENFIGMAPQAVAEEEVEEGVRDTIKKGVKSLKRGMKGWEKGMHDVDSVKAATKTLSPDSKEELLKAKVGKGSPAELQQKLIKREKNKQVDEATGYYSEKHPHHDRLIKNGYEHSIVDIQGDKLHRYFKPGVSLTDLYKYDDEKLDEVGDTDAGQKALVKTYKRAGSKAYRAGHAKDEYEHGYTSDELAKHHSRHRETMKQAQKRIKPETNYWAEEIEEDLGPEQKRVGQLGPTEKVKNNNIGKLVGASESTEFDPELARIIEMARFKR